MTEFKYKHMFAAEAEGIYFGPFEAPGASVRFEVVKDHLSAIWAADSAAALIGLLQSSVQSLRPAGQDLLVEFVPPEFEAELLAAGFHQQALYQEYWLTGLRETPVELPATIRMEPLTPQRAAEAAAITQTCRGHSRGFDGESADWVLEWLSDPNQTGFLAVQDGTALGVIFTAVYGFDHPNGAVCWVREVAVDPAHRNKKLARCLIQTALNWGIRRGAARSFLMADVQNAPGVALYEKLGFVKKEGEVQINYARKIENRE